MGNDDIPVTSTQIAQMAGVRPSAVSNWRRRPMGFPEPIGTGPRGAALFSRGEVIDWLRTHGYEPQEMDAAEAAVSPLHTLSGLLRPEDVVTLVLRWVLLADSLAPAQLDEMRSLLRDVGARATLEALCDVSRTLPGHHDGLWDVALRSPDSAIQPALEVCLREMPRGSRAALVEGLLDDAGVGKLGAENRTSADLAALLVDLAAPIGGVVCDPAVGLGDILMAAATRSRSDGTPLRRLVGQTVSLNNAWVTAERLALSGFEADIQTGDALVDQRLDRGIADVVICDPPYGVTLRPGMLKAADERWFAGTPAGRAYEFAWIQHALWLTRPEGGRAIVVTPLGATFASGRANDIRRELVARGMVEAVISLPAGSAGRATSVKLAVWILRWPTPGEPPADVVFIDAASRASDRRRPLTAELRAEIVRCLTDARSTSESVGAEPTFVNELEIAARASVDPGGVQHQMDLSPEAWVGEAALEEFYGVEWEHTPEILSGIDRAWWRTVMADSGPVDEKDIPAPHRLGDLIKGDQVVLIRGVRLRPGMTADEGVPIARAPSTAPRFLAPSAVTPDAVLTEPGDVVIRPSPVDHPVRISVVTRGGEVLAGTVVCLRSRSPQVPPRLLAAAVEAQAFRSPPPGAVTRNYTASQWINEIPVPRMSEGDAKAAAYALEAIDALERELETATQIVRDWRDLSTRIAAAGRVRFVLPKQDDPADGAGGSSD